MHSALFPALQGYLQGLPDPATVEVVPEAISVLAAWMARRLARGEEAPVIFICTHNSRRSIFAQAWLAACAKACGLESIHSYSGGTEETAVAQPALQALVRAGFEAETSTDGTSRITLRFSEDRPPLELFSKRFDHASHPAKGFAAVLLCDSAQAACPVVPGAEVRIFLPFPDPKRSDGTDRQETTYDQGCREVAAALHLAIHQTRIHVPLR